MHALSSGGEGSLTSALCPHVPSEAMTCIVTTKHPAEITYIYIEGPQCMHGNNMDCGYLGKQNLHDLIAPCCGNPGYQTGCWVTQTFFQDKKSKRIIHAEKAPVSPER